MHPHPLHPAHPFHPARPTEPPRARGQAAPGGPGPAVAPPFAVPLAACARLTVISGGQTGVDRAALDAAMALGLSCGGYCPKGRRALDGRIPARYPLCEIPESNYLARTRLNIQAAHATLVINVGPLSGGTLATLRLARREPGPGELPARLLLASLDGLANPLEQAGAWLSRLVRPGFVLNVAGPSERKAPGVGRLARKFLTRLFAGYASGSDHRPGMSRFPR